MEDCIFCKIAGKNIPCDIIYEDDHIVAFNDIHPQAPVHILLIPKKHIASILEVSDNDHMLMAQAAYAVKALAKQFNIDQSGFRLVVNTGENGGQTVPHLHFHLLGGRVMEWPPG